MIVYNFRCRDGHAFEEWFASSADYEARAAASGLTCPECGGSHVEKGLSAPRVNGGAAAPVGPCGRTACAAGPCQMPG